MKKDLGTVSVLKQVHGQLKEKADLYSEAQRVQVDILVDFRVREDSRLWYKVLIHFLSLPLCVSTTILQRGDCP